MQSTTHEAEMSEMRLQKYLSRAGVASRRKSETLITEGRVDVNGRTIRELGSKVVAGRDRVEVDGKRVDLATSLIYLLLNKPGETITTTEDPQGRPTVMDLLPANMPRVWPVGRLDWGTEGALLMTNDGDLTHALTHPAHEVEKAYEVKVRGLIAPDSENVTRIREGVTLDDGELTAPAGCLVLQDTGKNTWLGVTITEGRNRQIRRMFTSLGHEVSKLRRIAIGPLKLGELPIGSYRSLDYEEVEALYTAAGAEMPDSAQPSKRARKREEQRKRGGRSKASSSVSPKRGDGKTSGKKTSKGSTKRSSKTERPGNKDKHS